MARRTILHIGAMKSGTSHIQSRLFSNRKALLEAGVLVPGRKWTDQARGVTRPAPDPAARSPRGRRVLAADADEIHTHPGTAVVSMEFLGPSTPG